MRMAYDRYGRTPEMARRERAYEWFCVAGLLVLLAGCVVFASLIVALFSTVMGA